MVVGAVLGTALNIGQEILRKKRQGPVQVPEKRLYFACVECALFPIGLLWWAWTGKPDVHWIVPSCGVCCATIGIYTIFLAVNNYTADTYHRLASSALAAQSLSMPILPPSRVSVLIPRTADQQLQRAIYLAVCFLWRRNQCLLN